MEDCKAELHALLVEEVSGCHEHRDSLLRC